MLSKSQLSLLRKISKLKEYISTNDSSELSYLVSQGYVNRLSRGGDRWGKGATMYYQITEYGKAYLYDVRKSNMRFTIPVAVSVISLAISALAIYNSVL